MQEKSPSDPRRRPGMGLVGALLGVGLVAAVTVAAPRVAGLLLSSAVVAVPAALFSLVVGTPIAVVLCKTTLAGRRLAAAALGSLVLLPLYVTASAWMAALGDQGGAPSLLGPPPSGDGATIGGWIVGYPGAIFLHTVAGVAWAVLLVSAALRKVDRRLEEAALLDASAPRVLWSVTLRQSAPALAAIGVLLAVLAAAEMTMTDLLQVRTFAEEVYTQAAAGELLDPTAGGTWRLALGVATLGVFAGLAVTSLVGLLAVAGGVRQGEPWKWRPRSTKPLLGLIGLVVGGLFLLPVIALAFRAGVVVEPTADGAQRSFQLTKLVTSVAEAPWQHRRELAASASLAVCVTSFATLAGALLAWAIRGRRRVATVIGFALAMLLAIPGPVIGLVLIRALNQPIDSPLALLGDLYGTWFAPWLAQMVRITPVAALLLWPAAAGVSQRLLEAAQLDGAGPWGRIRFVTWPAMAPALAAAWLAAFALSLGELSATILVVPPGTPPLSVRMLSLLHYGVEDRVAALCLVLVAAYLLVAIAIGELLHLVTRAR